MSHIKAVYPKPSIAWFAIVVLMLVYTFSFIDRLILSLLVEPIKQDLGLSDVKDRWGYEKVILGGWSGGGSLSAFYQAEAEKATVTSTPAGAPPDLTTADL